MANMGYCGSGVTWSKDDAAALLAKAEMRFARVEVFINGEWLHLCRTDLTDDVCTYSDEDASRSLEETRTLYLRKIQYGARKKKGAFAVVDSFNDG